MQGRIWYYKVSYYEEERWRKKKLEIAAKLEKPGFEVHVGETGSNVRYKDYFNVTDQKVQLQQY